MAFLVLDLDETVMYVSQNVKYLHPAHHSWGSRSFRNESFNGNIAMVNLHIINPIELCDLITQALTQHSGVMILTSGLWSRNVLQFIAEQLPLRPELKQKFINSPFYSPIEELQYWSTPQDLSTVRNKIAVQVQRGVPEAVFWQGVDIDDFSLMREWIRRKLTKNERLNRIICMSQEMHCYADHYFLMLDNDRNHIQSFAHNPRVKAVHATTNTESDDFYAQAQTLLIELEQLEFEERLNSSNASLDSVLVAALDTMPTKPTSGLRTLGLFKEAPTPEEKFLTFDECCLL